MNDSYLRVRRLPDEDEPHGTQLEIIASNGTFTGSTDFYCNVSDLASIGLALRAFPQAIGNEYRYESGSSDPAARASCHFVLRAYTVGSWGKCALQISINQNGSEPYEGSCLFSMETEPASLNRLGTLFVTFGQLQHLEFKWVPNSQIAELYEHYQK